MNNKIKAAVAGAVLASASVANAGITWDAGEWTVDMNGNVNAFAIFADNKDSGDAIGGGLANTNTGTNNDRNTSISTGLLPSWLGFTGTTRQNDLDVSFTISMQPGSAQTEAGTGGGATLPENRQAFITFGDKSWGTVKIGKDLGIFGSDAILSDMTLLGVGSSPAGYGNGLTTTLGHIGTGYIYADWQGQVSFTTPNMNGFQATVGVMQPWKAIETGSSLSGTSTTTDHGYYGYEGKASYTASMGKVWVGFLQQDLEAITSTPARDAEATAYEIGVSGNAGNLGLVAYYYSGEGLGTTVKYRDAIDYTSGQERDSDGAFVQATYVIPSGTKLGVSYGRSDLDAVNTSDAGVAQNLVKRNEMWTVGAYHPLTKHLNLVAEYNDVTTESMGTADDNESNSVSLGAILFF